MRHSEGLFARTGLVFGRCVLPFDTPPRPCCRQGSVVQRNRNAPIEPATPDAPGVRRASTPHDSSARAPSIVATSACVCVGSLSLSLSLVLTLLSCDRHAARTSSNDAMAQMGDEERIGLCCVRGPIGERRQRRKRAFVGGGGVRSPLRRSPPGGRPSRALSRVLALARTYTHTHYLTPLQARTHTHHACSSRERHARALRHTDTPPLHTSAGPSAAANDGRARHVPVGLRARGGARGPADRRGARDRQVSGGV